MKHRFAMGVLFFIVFLSVPVAIAQPLPPPLSPDETRLLAEYPALNEARASGAGIVLAGVDQFGCANSAMKLNLAVFIAKPGPNYVIRTVVYSGTSSILMHMHQRVVFPLVSGWYIWTLSDTANDGPAGSGFPLPSGTPVRVQVLLSQENGKPLAYSEMTVNDCDGVPATTSSAFSSPVRIVSTNPAFQPDSADPTRAANWKPSGKVAFSCALTGVCTEKLTGKAGKTASLKQTSKLSPAVGINARFGVVVVGDFSDAAGLVQLNITLRYGSAPLTFMQVALVIENTPVYFGSEAAFLPIGAPLTVEFNRVVTELTFADASDGTPVASGKLKIKAIYVFATD